MSPLVRWIVVGAMVMAGGATRASAQTACDRTCLRTLLDQYLAAVSKHDPAAAPLVVGFRQTENAINVRPGNGVWKTVTGLGKAQRRYLDPVTGQAAYYGTVEEGANTAIVTVRVRVENRQLTEAEWFLARADDPGLNGARQPGRPPANLHNPEYLAQNPPPDRIVPATSARTGPHLCASSTATSTPSRRATTPLRSPMRAAAELRTARRRRRGAFCRRLRQPAAGRAEAGRSSAAGADATVGRPATTAFEPGQLQPAMVVARRVPLVDEEAQVVLAYAVFIRRPDRRRHGTSSANGS